jgi:hypothetical protein
MKNTRMLSSQSVMSPSATRLAMNLAMTALGPARPQAPEVKPALVMS